jgi:Flp pilus assembly protein TadG
MKTAIKLLRKHPQPGWDEGATAVEAAIALFALVLLLFGIIHFGYALWQLNTMMLAVEQAGRYAMINNQSTTLISDAESQMQAVLTTATVCTTPSAGHVCVNATTTAGPPPTMTLTAAYNFNLIAPFIPAFTMKSQALVPLD